MGSSCSNNKIVPHDIEPKLSVSTTIIPLRTSPFCLDISRDPLSIILTIPCPILVFTKQCYITHINNEFKFFTGYTNLDLIGKKCNKLMPKKHNEKDNEYIFSNNLFINLNIVFQIIMVMKNGYNRKVEVCCFNPLSDETYTCMIIRDRTEINVLENQIKILKCSINGYKNIIDTTYPSFLLPYIRTNRLDKRFVHKNIIIGFFDVKGYTELSSTTQPMLILEQLYTQINEICIKYETICVEVQGDAAMIAGNADITRSQISVDNFIKMLFNCIRAGNNLGLHIRCGMDIGGAISGLVLGQYRIFGDVTNVASRMESMADADTILCTRNVYICIEKKSSFVIKSILPRDVKGKGKMQTYSISKIL